MVGGFLEIERDGPVVIVTLNRPAERNAITDVSQCREIVALCGDLAEDRSVRAMVLTGAGTAFCAGGNIKQMRDREGTFAGTPYDQRSAYRTTFQTIANALYALEVPVVAAINGPAIGLGLDIACMCDIRIMSSAATVAESYVKLGIIPGGGGAWALPRVIGLARASQLTLTGELIDAATALQYGLVSEIVEPDVLIDRARAIAATIAANPGHATRMAKRLIREGMDMKLPTALEMAAAYQALSHHTADHLEAVDAFLARRQPELLDR